MEPRIFTCHLGDTLVRFIGFVKLKGGHVHANLTLPVYTRDGEVQCRQYACVYSHEEELCIEEKCIGSPEVEQQAEHGATFLSSLVCPSEYTVGWLKQVATNLGYKVLD